MMFSFYLNWIFWLKPYKTLWKWVLSLNVVFQIFPNQFFGGTITLGNSQKNPVIVFNMSFIVIHLFEVTKLQFHAFHWWGCNVRSRLSCYPAQNLDDTPGPQLLFHGRKATFRGATVWLPNRGSSAKSVKKPNLPTNSPHHLGALVVIVCQTSTKQAV